MCEGWFARIKNLVLNYVLSSTEVLKIYDLRLPLKVFHELNAPFTQMYSNKHILHKIQLMNKIIF
jgi:hypothetical protein